ncbi:MAG: hypothetical protein LBC65_01755 [Oscillospiraceae bacterium]|jgi:hypothetical protein|nr:hypothetical protein [Oscillospiraceae bacterium]
MQETEIIIAAPDSDEESVGHKMKWTGFVETALVDFFSAYKLEKLQVEDGNGNKAKLSLTKDNSIKIELSSISII